MLIFLDKFCTTSDTSHPDSEENVRSKVSAWVTDQRNKETGFNRKLSRDSPTSHREFCRGLAGLFPFFGCDAAISVMWRLQRSLLVIWF
jgi:hypothetical protein